MRQNKKKAALLPWATCLLCTSVVFCAMGFPTGGFFPYLPFIQETGYTATQTSFLITVRCLSSMVAMVFITHYYERFSIRLGMTLACVTLAAGLYIMSIAHSYSFYVAGIAVMGIAYSAAGMVPAAMLMGNWFAKSRATAIAVCSIGSALAASVLPAAETALVLRYCLSVSFLTGAFFVCAVLAVFYLFVRDTPEEKGCLAYGAEPVPESAAGGLSAAGDGPAVGDGPAAGNRTADSSAKAQGAARERSGGTDLGGVMRLVMMAAMLLVGGYAMAAQGHFSTLMIAEGYSKEQAAFGFSMMGTVLILGKFLYGRLTDFFGARLASLITLSLLACGYILCAIPIVSMPVLIVRAFLIGMGLPFCTVGIPVTARELSSAKQYPKTLRNYQLGYTAGGMIFSSFPGILYDRLHNYNISYGICAAAVIGVLTVLLLAYRQIGRGGSAETR